jgi:hypothetical protein
LIDLGFIQVNNRLEILGVIAIFELRSQ